MPGLLVDKDLLTRLTFHFSSPTERRVVQLSRSVLFIRKRWGKVGNFCLRKKRGELRWVYGQMGERSCRCWKGQSSALFNATIMQRAMYCHQHARRTRLHSALSYMKDMNMSTAMHIRSEAQLEKRQARNRSIDISIDRMCICGNWCIFGSSLGAYSYHGVRGAEVMVRVLPPTIIAAALGQYDVKTIHSMPKVNICLATTQAKIKILINSFQHFLKPKDYIMTWFK